MSRLREWSSEMMDDNTREAVEAGVLNKLLSHLRARSDVQNIDIMDLAGFCRNCLSKWYMQSAKDQGIEISKEAAREIIYGMPYDEWKKKHQKPH